MTSSRCARSSVYSPIALCLLLSLQPSILGLAASHDSRFVNLCSALCDDRVMSVDSEQRTLISTVCHAFGVARPTPGWWAWLRDPHFLIAVLAAVPVWLALGLTVGDRMHVAFTAISLMSFLGVQPVFEELAFRGALQGFLLQRGGARRIGPISRANLATTAAFVALHFAAQPPAWAIAVTVPSLVFGHLRERFASVVPSIVLHSIYNAGFALTAWIARN